ncbi:dynein light chain Tctex-type 1C [Cricetulus griseus]
MGHGRVAAEIQVWRGPAWGAAATSAHGHAVAVPSGPLRGFPAWAVPAVGGAPGLAGAQVPRSEDDITPPRLRCCGPRPGPGWERRDPAVASMMTRARRASSRSLKWGSAVPAVRLPSADAQTEPAFVSTAFVVDEVSNIVKEAIESAIGGNAYQHSKVNQWTTNVVEQTLSQLTKLGKPFKYIVTCVIMQKNGAGLHTASSCFWDSSTDGSCTVRWENKTMYCIVSAFGLSI